MVATKSEGAERAGTTPVATASGEVGGAVRGKSDKAVAGALDSGGFEQSNGAGLVTGTAGLAPTGSNDDPSRAFAALDSKNETAEAAAGLAV